MALLRCRAGFAVLAALLAATGCGPGGDDSPAVVVTTTRPDTTSTAPTSTTTSPVVTTAPAQPATGACPSVPARAAPLPDRPRYRLRVGVRPAENLVDGDLTVRFTPDVETDRLVFRLWPNSPRTAAAGARLEVAGVDVGGRPATTSLTGPTTLEVLTGRLAPGRAVEVAARWRLTLPGEVNDRVSRSGDAVRLGSFFPLLAWEPGVGWATDPPTSAFAEATSSPAADFDVRIDVPPGLQVLSTGTPAGPGRWTAGAVPDFGISVGRFTTATATAHAPLPVQVTVGVAAGTGESPGRYLSRVVQALEDFSRRYGAYPWPSYSLAVTPGLSGGIEYPMHVFQGPGTAGRTTPHEVAHMWFYGLVATNQGATPWIDEGLATYAEG
ncbi:MAG TPA: hypothetical protein VHE80_04125, partial [Acidimicrobiales bacterium]|nr:hypothetical protein [Acidimicrobiales bacterium]